MKKDTPKLKNVIEIDEARIRDHLGELVRIFWVTFLTGYKLESIGGLIQRVGFLVTLFWMFFIAITRFKWKT